MLSVIKEMKTNKIIRIETSVIKNQYWSSSRL